MSTPGQPQGFADSWNTRMRLIRMRRKKESFRFGDEFRIVPRWLKYLCLTLYVIALFIGVSVMLNVPDARPHDLSDNPTVAALAIVGIITGAAIVLSTFLFLLGYVNRDAKRRGMNSALWTLLVLILSPGYVGIGFVIYFLIRDPLPYPCPRCHNLVAPRFNFCPSCKCNLYPSCPNCKNEVAETDRYCPYCAYTLSSEGESGALAAPTNSAEP